MININNILNANEVLAGIVRETPVLFSEELNKALGVNLFLKAECNQINGSFKSRGAYFAMHQYFKEHKKKDVVAFSSGNHAQGVAYAASLMEVNATIVMPEDTPIMKIEKTKSLGAKVVFYNRYKESRQAIAKKIALETAAFLIPAYDHFDVISGQGTAALEAIHQMALIEEQINYFICPVGGGGLIAGCSIAIKHYFDQSKIIGVEPELFNDTQLSIKNGKRTSIDISQSTLCDALMARTPGELTFPINQDLLTSVETVNEQQIKQAMRFAFEEFNLVVEPGGAVALAFALNHNFPIKNANILILLSGGNIDPDRFDELIK